MDLRKIKKDKNNASDGAKKLITTLIMLVGLVLFFIAFVAFIFWLATKNMFQ